MKFENYSSDLQDNKENVSEEIQDKSEGFMTNTDEMESLAAESAENLNYERIEKVGGFDELFDLIEEIGGVRGSDKVIQNPKELTERINSLREEGLAKIITITRTGGLRAKVAELYKKEIDEKLSEAA